MSSLAVTSALSAPCASARCGAGAVRARTALAPCRTSLSVASGFMGTKLGVGSLLRAPRNASKLVTQASLFGVGAPEAVLVGVVALVVFGPKGLAEAAKSLGSTLRAFQPTIRELASVSNDLKSTLEEEIGLDEIKRDLKGMPPVPEPRPSQPAAASADTTAAGTAAAATTSTDKKAATTDAAAATPAAAAPTEEKQLAAINEQQVKILDPKIDEKRAASAEQAWGTTPPSPPKEAPPPPAPKAEKEELSQKDISAMSMEELEAEIAKRKAAEAK